MSQSQPLTQRQIKARAQRALRGKRYKPKTKEEAKNLRYWRVQQSPKLRMQAFKRTEKKRNRRLSKAERQRLKAATSSPPGSSSAKVSSSTSASSPPTTTSPPTANNSYFSPSTDSSALAPPPYQGYSSAPSSQTSPPMSSSTTLNTPAVPSATLSVRYPSDEALPTDEPAEGSAINPAATDAQAPVVRSGGLPEAPPTETLGVHSATNSANSRNPLSVSTHFNTLKAFSEACRQDRGITAATQLIYRLLIEECNRSRWAEGFMVSISTLEEVTHLSRHTIMDARQRLKSKGYIDFRGKPSQYTLYSL